ncbi:MAG: hypothetical protein JSS27_02530 [Planctomycetes bacterium]|nr:hypothetical protein [Planctomycetota bacterium]
MTTPNVAGDHQVWDGVETIVVSTAQCARHTLAGVLVRGQSASQSAAGGVLNVPATERAFVIPTSTAGDYQPTLGDIITDARSDKWRVAAIETLTLSSRWRVVGQRLLE